MTSRSRPRRLLLQPDRPRLWERVREEKARAERWRSEEPKPQASAVPASRFVKPSVVVPRNPMVVDPEAVRVPDPSGEIVVGNSIPVADFYDPNHPDAVQFQCSTPRDPTRGLTIDELDAEQGACQRVRALTDASSGVPNIHDAHPTKASPLTLAAFSFLPSPLIFPTYMKRQ